MRRRLGPPVAIPVLAAALLLAACGSGSSGTPGPSTTSGTTPSASGTVTTTGGADPTGTLPPDDPCTMVPASVYKKFADLRSRSSLTQERTLSVEPGGAFFGCTINADGVLPQVAFGYFLNPDGFAIADGTIKADVFHSDHRGDAVDKKLDRVMTIFDQKKVRVPGMGDDAFITHFLFFTDAYAKVGSQTVRLQLNSLYRSGSVSGQDLADALGSEVGDATTWTAAPPPIAVSGGCPSATDPVVTAVTGPVGYARGDSSATYAFCSYLGTNGTSYDVLRRRLASAGVHAEAQNYKPRRHVLASSSGRLASWEMRALNEFSYLDLRSHPDGTGEEFIATVAGAGGKVPASGSQPADLALTRQLFGTLTLR